MELNKIICGNSLEVLKTLPDESINCVITSPPFWGLRSYNTVAQIFGGNAKCQHEWISHKENPKGGKGNINANVRANQPNESNKCDKPTITNFCVKCNAWKGELGSEPDFNLFISHLCDVFDEIKRVLTKDGTVWCNLGDSYAGSQSTNSSIKTANQINSHQTDSYRTEAINKKVLGIKNKSLCLIPPRFAIEMVSRGWILRNVVIWQKPNCMPASITDRFTVDWEYLFFFVKSPKYFFV